MRPSKVVSTLNSASGAKHNDFKTAPSYQDVNVAEEMMKFLDAENPAIIKTVYFKNKKLDQSKSHGYKKKCPDSDCQDIENNTNRKVDWDKYQRKDKNHYLKRCKSKDRSRSRYF